MPIDTSLDYESANNSSLPKTSVSPVLTFEESFARIVPSLHRSSEMLDPSIPTLPFYIYPECVPAMPSSHPATKFLYYS